jgi:hypothetical protein
MIETTKSIILHQRDRILRALVDLAVRDRKKDVVESFRRDAEFLILELSATQDVLIKMNEEPGKTKYAPCPRPIDAILAVLDDIGRPLSQDDITEKILAGGFRGAVHGTESLINLGIKNFLTGTGKAKGHIKQIGGLIGRADWEESRFKAR